MVRLDDVPGAGVEGGPQERRAVELVADELGPLGSDHQEADQAVVGRDPGVLAQDRLAEHRRPLDLEQEADLAADVPDAVDVGQLLGGRADDPEVRALLPVVEEVAEGAAADPPRLLATADPDAHPEPVARLGDRREEVRVLLAPAAAGRPW